MLNIVLYQPEIPPNTGNIIRLAANTGSPLHLIEPMGFVLDDKKLRRAGLDYREFSTLHIHQGWEAFLKTTSPTRLLGISTKGKAHYGDIEFRADDFVVFGPESRGLPDSIRQSLPEKHLLRIPMLASSRSLNLSNAVAVIVYEAWRQQGFVNGN